MGAADPRGRPAAMLCYDGSDAASAAVEGGAALLAPRPAIVVYVYDPVPAAPVQRAPAPGVGAELASAAVTAGVPDEVVEAAERAARECAEAGAELARRRGFRPQPLAVATRGNVADTLLAVGREWNAAPLVVGGRGHGLLKSAVLGSVSTALVRAGELPVLVLPPPAEG